MIHKMQNINVCLWQLTLMVACKIEVILCDIVFGWFVVHCGLYNCKS